MTPYPYDFSYPAKINAISFYHIDLLLIFTDQLSQPCRMADRILVNRCFLHNKKCGFDLNNKS